MPTTPIQRLDNTLESGKVLRYHAVPTVRPQTIAQHVYGVMVLGIYIAAENVSLALLTEMMLHDSGEYITGDIPYTTKRDNPGLRDVLHAMENKGRVEHMLLPEAILTSREKAILKVCDTLEGLIWCALHEERHGPVADRWHAAYRIARTKFATELSGEEWNRADEIFETYAKAPVTANSTTR